MSGLLEGLAPYRDRDAMSVLVVHEDVGPAGLSVLHHRQQWTSLQAQLLTTVRDVAQEPFRAAVAQNFVGTVTADALRAAVPVRDAPVHVDEVDAIGDVAEQVLVELLVHGSSAVPRCWVCMPGGHLKFSSLLPPQRFGSGSCYVSGCLVANGQTRPVHPPAGSPGRQAAHPSFTLARTLTSRCPRTGPRPSTARGCGMY